VPCIGCARAIINAGIVEVHCLDDGRYAYDEVVDLLSEACVIINIYPAGLISPAGT
jgi:deoxycytidylate deaminase